MRIQDYSKISSSSTLKEKTADGFWFTSSICDQDFNTTYTTEIKVVKNGGAFLIDEVYIPF